MRQNSPVFVENNINLRGKPSLLCDGSAGQRRLQGVSQDSTPDDKNLTKKVNMLD